jgi:hypothetical protein
MAWEASQGADARRALLARLVLEVRLGTQDPLASSSGDWEGEAVELLLSDRDVSLSGAIKLLV